MSDVWERLQSVATESLDLMWYEFAKEGRESAIFAPLGAYPGAASWLAGCMAMADDCIVRKLAAMLIGWVDHPRAIEQLSTMLRHERQAFAADPLTANSVGEDIMFAATRWTASSHPEVADAGRQVLAGMIRDALTGTPWNTANWATANLYRATNGSHDILREIDTVMDEQLKGQEFFRKAVTAVRGGDRETLAKLATPPGPPEVLASDDPNFAQVSKLWAAVAAAEQTLQQ